LSLKQIRLIPGDLIYEKDDVENHNLYFIEKGKVELFVPKKGFFEFENE